MKRFFAFFRAALAFTRVPLQGMGFDYRLRQVATPFRTKEGPQPLPALFAGKISFSFPCLAAEGAL